MDLRRLSAYLGARFGEPIVVTSVRQTFPGMSRETWLVEIERGAGKSREGLVVRADPPGGSIVPIPLRYEWNVYECLNRTSIPVATPYWYDDAPDITSGRPLFVRSMVEGVTYPPGLQADTDEAAERRKHVVLEYIEKIAAVHRLDWKACGFDAFMEVETSPEKVIRAELMRWWKTWRKSAPSRSRSLPKCSTGFWSTFPSVPPP